MTLLTIAHDVCLDIGINVPDVVATSTEREYVELLNHINATGTELARRADWGGLTKTATLAGNGTSDPLALPGASMRLTSGITVTRSDGAIVRPLTRAEWNMTPVEGDPRYFLLQDTKISFWPYLANAATCTARYQSDAWCLSADMTTYTSQFTADAQTAVMPEDLVTKGAVARWKRQKGLPYQDQEAEYEAALAQYAEFDDRNRL